jgi:hypothetical protein
MVSYILDRSRVEKRCLDPRGQRLLRPTRRRSVVLSRFFGRLHQVAIVRWLWRERSQGGCADDRQG